MFTSIISVPTTRTWHTGRIRPGRMEQFRGICIQQFLPAHSEQFIHHPRRSSSDVYGCFRRGALQSQVNLFVFQQQMTRFCPALRILSARGSQVERGQLPVRQGVHIRPSGDQSDGGVETAPAGRAVQRSPAVFSPSVQVCSMVQKIPDYLE